MNYDEIKRVLLDDSKRLASKEAKDIIFCWKRDPGLLEKLLSDDDCTCTLRVYDSYSSDDNAHYFIESNVRFVSEKIALKFLEAQNDIVSANFIDIVSAIAFKDEEESPVVFAWPFLSERSLECLTYGVIKHLIANNFFVFDFSSDTEGNIFACFVNIVSDDMYLTELLAVNSFNITSYVSNSKFVDQMELSGAITLYAYSSHGFSNDSTDYGIYRKLFIRYMSFVLNTVETVKEHMQVKK